MKISELKKALPFILDSDVTPMLVGTHGVGKTESVVQFCRDNGYMLKTINLGTLSDSGDLIGIPDVIGESNSKMTVFGTPDWIVEIVNYSTKNPKSKAIIYLDEINRARRDLLQAVFSLVLEKRIHTIKFPTNVKVIAAMNPNTEDYIVTDMSDKAFLDRFCFIKVSPSTDEWLDYAKVNKFDNSIVEFISAQPELLQQKSEEFSFDEIQPSRRSWEFISKITKTNMDKSLLKELAFGVVGVPATIAFFKFLEDDKNKPLTGEEIVKSYLKFKEKIVEMSKNKDEKRFDLLKITGDNVLSYVNQMTEFKEDDFKNLEGFLLDIPMEISFYITKELMKNVDRLPSILKFASESKLLVERLKKFTPTKNVTKDE